MRVTRFPSGCVCLNHGKYVGTPLWILSIELFKLIKLTRKRIETIVKLIYTKM